MKRGLALLAAAASRSRRSRQPARRTPTRRLRAPAALSSQPLVSEWTPALGSAFGYTLQYSAVGSGAGIAAITHRRSTSAPPTRR